MHISKDELLKQMSDLDAEIAAAEKIIFAAQAKRSVYESLLGFNDDDKKDIKKRTRSPSKNWDDILRFIGSGRKDVDDIISFASEATGTELTRNSVRSQMSNYRKKGYVAAPDGQGGYTLTESGRQRYVTVNDDAELDQKTCSPSTQPALNPNSVRVEPSMGSNAMN